MTTTKCQRGQFMYKNKYGDRNNIVGIEIKRLRQGKSMSQRALADALQLEGLDMEKNAVQRIESGERFVTDIELFAFAKVLGCEIEALY